MIAVTNDQRVPQPLRLRSSLIALALIAVSSLIATSPLVTHSQSGRQKGPTPSPTPARTTRSRQVGKPTSQQANQPTTNQTANSSDTSQSNANDGDDVVRVSSNLVAVPATVVDSNGVAVTNLKLEDFELRVDGLPNAIREISRADTPVRMAMLFDNSGSLSESRDFEKRAAIKFFRNVLRPVDQAAVFSVATDVMLAEPLTNDARRLELTIDSFGKPEGATSLFDGIIQAGTYLHPYPGRRVVVIARFMSSRPAFMRTRTCARWPPSAACRNLPRRRAAPFMCPSQPMILTMPLPKSLLTWPSNTSLVITRLRISVTASITSSLSG